MTLEQTIYWLHRAAAAARCINLLRMVWQVPKLTGANVHYGLGGAFGVLWRPYGVLSWARRTKKSHFTTTTIPHRISYIGILRISTGIEKILSQFSFNDGTKRKALSLTVMITMTMTMKDDDDASNNDGNNDGGDDGDDDDEDGNNDGGGGDDSDNHDGGNDDKTTTR